MLGTEVRQHTTRYSNGLNPFPQAFFKCGMAGMDKARLAAVLLAALDDPKDRVR